LCKSVEEYFVEGMNVVSAVNGDGISVEAVQKKAKTQEDGQDQTVNAVND